MTAIVISPHFDDAALSALSPILDGAEVVNVFTAGPAGAAPSPWEVRCGLGMLDAEGAMKVRAEEDREALGLVGAAVTNVGIYPVDYRRASATAVAEGLAGAVGDRPSLLYVPVAGSDAPHPDHVVARDGALRYAAKLGIPTVLYADYPYVARRGWPVEIDPTSGRSASRWWRKVGLAMPGRRVVELTGDRLESKRKVVQAYRTQIKSLDRVYAQWGCIRSEAWRIEVYWGEESLCPAT